MIVYLFIDKFPEDTEPSTIWYLFAGEVLIETMLIVLLIAFVEMFF